MRSSSFRDYYSSDGGRRFLLEQCALLAAAACVLLAVFGGSDLDLAVTRLFFDTAHGRFPWTNDWWLKTVLHDDTRTVAALGLLALLGVTAAAWLLPRLTRVHEARHALTFVTAAAIATAATLAAAKHLSGHACPWDTAGFGGIVPYRRLLEPHGPLPPFRGCFPAAHPLVGFGWLGVGFALFPSARRSARLATLGALAVGTAFGLVQVARGAHFASHVLWTAWTAWAVNLALLWLYRWLGARAVRETPRPLGRAAPAELAPREAPRF
jgi:membrane-associated PAP2 superfamily phosphatase